MARTLGAPYVRVDRIEQAVVDWTPLEHPVGAVGYGVAHALTREQLDLGLGVVVECVNPLAVTRDAWVSTARDAGAALVEVELVCTDPVEHRRRVETRETDVDGLVKPTWEQVVDREYEPWTRDHVVADTASLPAAESAEQVARAVARVRRGAVRR